MLAHIATRHDILLRYRINLTSISKLVQLFDQGNLLPICLGSII